LSAQFVSNAITAHSAADLWPATISSISPVLNLWRLDCYTALMFIIYLISILGQQHDFEPVYWFA
jgi:hypothetical protein